MDKRYQEKIRKLLALSQSDNPHEAEAAKRQATALMKKHRIDEDDLEIIEVNTRLIPRKNLKDFEFSLVSAVAAIAGVYCVQDYEHKVRRGRIQWFTKVTFIGLERDAQLAAYSFDVLYQQLDKARSDFKKKFGANTQQQDLFGRGWVISAGSKLVNVFGQRDQPSEVVNHYKKKSVGMQPVKPRKTKEGSTEVTLACSSMGYMQGKDALLNQATTNQQEQQLRLGSIQ
jgi:hypothetical protein